MCTPAASTIKKFIQKNQNEISNVNKNNAQELYEVQKIVSFYYLKNSNFLVYLLFTH